MRLPVLLAGLLFLCGGDAWADGRMLVSLANRNRILAFDATSGASLGTFAETGAGVRPVAMAFGPDRNLYVSGLDSGSILKFDGNSGELLGEFARVEKPSCLAWGPDLSLYVCSLATQNVLRLNGSTGAVMGSIGNALTLTPNGLAFYPDGSLLVLNSVLDGQMLRFDPGNGTLVSTTRASGMRSPLSIAIGAGGDIFVGVINGLILRYRTDLAVWDYFITSPTIEDGLSVTIGPNGLFVLNASGSVVRLDSSSPQLTSVVANFASPADGASALVFTPDVLPVRLEAVSGDGQSVVINTLTVEPLTVLVTGINGPMANQSVEFAVVLGGSDTGRGFPTARSLVTDSLGLARTDVRGNATGALIVRATSGTATADFHLTILGRPDPSDPQISPGGVLHAARRTPAGVPGSTLVRGGLMVIRGQNLGPSQEMESGPPYPTELPDGGTRVEISAAGLSSPILARILSTTSNEVYALVPSQTPQSRVQIRVFYGGKTSRPEPVNVVSANFGIYTENGLGSGPAVAFVLDSSGVSRPVTLLNPARAGDLVVLRGSGLGPTADDIDTSLLLPLEDAVLVAGTSTPVVSGGRASDLPGVDEIRFVMPDDVPDGCYVPVATRRGTVYSNFATVAKAGRDTQGGCAHPLGLTDTQLAGLSRGERVTGGVLGFYGVSLESPFGTSDFGNAGGIFTQFDSNSLYLAGGGTATTMVDGACSVFTRIAPISGQLLFPVPAGKGLDAGVLRVRGPEGQSWSVRQSANGGYIVAEGIPSGTDQPRPATPGRWTIGSVGGPDIGEFLATLDIPEPVVWLNKKDVALIDRSADLTFSWNPEPGESAELMLASVLFTGQPADLAGIVQVQVTCAAEFNTGFMTIPAGMLSQLPPTTSESLAFAFLTNSPFDRRVQSFAAKMADGRVLGNNRITSVVGQAKFVDLH